MQNKDLENAFLMGWQGFRANPFLPTSQTSDCWEIGAIFKRENIACDYKTLIIKKSRGDSYRINGQLYKISYNPFNAVKAA
jgi:hypothetical protein